MEHELDLLDHLNDTVTRITEDTLLLSLLLDYMDGLSCRPEQVSRESPKTSSSGWGTAWSRTPAPSAACGSPTGSPAAAGRTCSSPAAGRFSICRSA